MARRVTMRRRIPSDAIATTVAILAACLMAGACTENVDAEFDEDDFIDDPVAEDRFDEWDDDDDELLDEDEFDDGLYDEFDLDGDGLLSDEEIGRALPAFDTFDVDVSEVLDEDEVDAMFDTWDENADDVIDRDEFGFAS